MLPILCDLACTGQEENTFEVPSNRPVLFANLHQPGWHATNPVSRLNVNNILSVSSDPLLTPKLGTSSRFQRAARLREVHKKAAAAKSKVDNLTSFFGKSEHVDDDEGPFCIFSDDSLYV